MPSLLSRSGILAIEEALRTELAEARKQRFRDAVYDINIVLQVLNISSCNPRQYPW